MSIAEIITEEPEAPCPYCEGHSETIRAANGHLEVTRACRHLALVISSTDGHGVRRWMWRFDSDMTPRKSNTW